MHFEQWGDALHTKNFIVFATKQYLLWGTHGGGFEFWVLLLSLFYFIVVGVDYWSIWEGLA